MTLGIDLQLPVMTFAQSNGILMSEGVNFPTLGVITPTLQIVEDDRNLNGLACTWWTQL